MERITRKHLEAMCVQINRATGSPETPYTQDAVGKFHANIGNYHIDGAYGGWSLHQMHNAGGGVTTPLVCGHVPARDLLNRMHAFLAGITVPRL